VIKDHNLKFALTRLNNYFFHHPNYLLTKHFLFVMERNLY